MLDPVALRTCLAAVPPRRIEHGLLRPAAVLLPLYSRAGEDLLLFTRRTATLRHHRGEIAFPGGAAEAMDDDLAATALRETEEEVGIPAGAVTLLGRLDDFVSVHAYHVTPYVGLLTEPPQLHPDPAEIAAVIELPLARLCEPARWHRENWRHRGLLETVYFCTVDGHQIWGLTAAILRQFLQRIDRLPG
ncbi:MAG: hypothetical protein A2005_02305 [Desulfuromonadales bacterium GWC2_61_20]|nr:MAG: hypothetical protein A2005_02305 [Desulfuromonadales bacterium GWC2_61_20]HAD03428.1 CoA pyrophosphatase [Desulfuromonas sp.]